jgi:hypothetical protein
MFEAIISNINTGRVHRRLFDSRDDAASYAETWVRSGWRRPENHRVEIHARERLQPQTKSVAAPAAA